MPRDAPPLAEATATMIVDERDLASTLSPGNGDAFPPVFATSRMIALMEIAAARALVPLLEDDELSVGVALDVQHTAPTPAGERVTATAHYRRMLGKLYRFEVVASDHAGEVGRGTHDRAIVKVQRLVDAAAKRRGGPAQSGQKH
jgi:predicted thioesterase